ncbi:hypothetical protein MIR68_010550 [Amoeboaphelidium protococcarum]|nr:hypothetical protein MIR68_010550 [Amoeboaphelidium protococcarum]
MTKYHLINNYHNDSMTKFMLRAGSLMTAAVVATLLISVVTLYNRLDNLSFSIGSCDGNRDYLPDNVHIDNIMKHMQALETIALTHPNRSRSVMNGYAKSAEYVMHQLKTKTECDVSIQKFKVPVWTKYSSSLALAKPLKIQFQDGVDFNLMRYGGVSSSVESASLFVVPEGKSGCDMADFDGIGKHQIALLPYDPATCPLFNSSFNAEQSGASAVIYTLQQKRQTLPNSRVRLEKWFEGDPLVHIPTLVVSYSNGQLLRRQSDSVALNLTTVTDLTVFETFNVICQTKEGNQDDVAMMGAHLDSVPVEGDTGMSDNASGSSALLEVVLELYKTGMNKSLKNGMRFAWWGAEEIGLMGSRYYVKTLQENPTEHRKVLVYGNHDMLGSPNYVPFIYEGSSAPSDNLRKSSTQLQLLYEDFYASLPMDSKFHRNFAYSAMTGGSDFYSFLEGGIASGGLATGAGGLKTVEQREKFGGLANAPLDPCYHQYCDTLLNIDRQVLELNAKAVAFVTQRLGQMDNLRLVFGA